MKLKRVTLTLVGAMTAVTAAVVLVPGPAYAASSHSLWVNASEPVPATGPHNSCTTPGYNTIQAAIDAAAVAAPAGGDTIHVCPPDADAPYVEQLTITDPVSIVAAGPGVTVQLPVTPADSTTPCDAAGLAGFPGQPDQDEISICTAGTVNISGINVQALWPSGTCYDSLYGILVAGGATLKMSSATVAGAGADPINGCQGGIGVQVGMSWSDPVEVGHALLNDVSISEYQKNGITVDGTGSTATIRATTVTGAGATPAIAQNGIQVSYGAGARITDSDIAGDECDVAVCGPDSQTQTQSTGILFYGAEPGSSITHSSVKNSDIGVYSLDMEPTAPVTANVSVTHDTLTGDRYEAVALDQGYTVVSNDTISGGNVGIQVLQYDGQDYGVKAVARDDTITGMAVAAAQVSSDNAVSGDLPGSMSITKSKISNNPTGASILGSVLDNSPSYASYLDTIKQDT